MADCTDDTDDAPDDSWADVIEDFEELGETFRREAAENRRRQAEAPAPRTERQELVTPPSEEYDPDVYLVVPHYSGAERKSVPRRPGAAPPLYSHALSITHAASGRSAEGDRGGVPDAEYEVACTVRNVGGTVAHATTYELFVEHRRPDAVLDTASDGVYESEPEITTFSGFCTLESGADRLYVLGYVGSEPKPENVRFRSKPDDGGGVGGDVRQDRTFSFEESIWPSQPVGAMVTSPSAMESDTFTVRLYYNRNGAVDSNPPYYVSPEERSVDPTRTYLRTSSADDAGDADPIDLGSLGIPPGDTVKLTRLGSYEKQGTGGFGMVGVFSASSTLAPSDQRHRVVDAIDAGDDVRTDATYLENLETDVPEDFQISNRDGTDRSVTLPVPSGAGYLFVSPIDNHFQDNTDEDGDYRLRITSEKRQRESLSETVSTLDNQGFLLAETEARVPTDRDPANEKNPLDLASTVADATLVDQQKVAVPPTGETTVTTGYTSPSNAGSPPTTLTAFYARVYSLSAPDDPADWDRLDHTTSRFVGRTEFTWD